MKNILILLILAISFLTPNLLLAVEDEPIFDFPVDADLYLVRPGDKLVVSFINAKIKSLNLTVNPEGYIIDETIGIFDARFQRLSDVKKDLFGKLKDLYNVSDISISIEKPRKVTIAIHGAIKKPGIYQGLTSDRVSSIIKKAGGISSNGSRRTIIFHSGKDSIAVDLDRAEFIGDFDANPNLYAGISIFIPSKSKETIQIIGEVNNPREIELKKDDNLSDLLALVGGLRSFADSSNIKIIRGNKSFAPIDIQHNDILVIPAKIAKANDFRVTIIGAINNPGHYLLNGDMSFTNLVQKAGGFQDGANKELTTIFRKPKVDLDGRVTELRFPISLPVGTLPEAFDILLNSEDSIFVPVQVGFVKVSGEVLNPGYYPYHPGKDVKYYVTNSGGFLPTANTQEIQIFNPVSQLTSQVSMGVHVADGSEIVIAVKEELR